MLRGLNVIEVSGFGAPLSDLPRLPEGGRQRVADLFRQSRILAEFMPSADVASRLDMFDELVKAGMAPDAALDWTTRDPSMWLDP